MGSKSVERVPFQVTRAGAAYENIRELPALVLLDNFRSLYNVGSFFRTADAAAIRRIILCGVTGCPPDPAISKTALGAESTVPWQYVPEPLAVMDALRFEGVELAAIETGPGSVDLFDWRPRFPVCVAFGNEVEGLRPELLERAETRIQIPMLGLKHSLNVSTAGGIVMFELLRKYRNLCTQAG